MLHARGHIGRRAGSDGPLAAAAVVGGGLAAAAIAVATILSHLDASALLHPFAAVTARASALNPFLGAEMTAPAPEAAGPAVSPTNSPLAAASSSAARSASLLDLAASFPSPPRGRRAAAPVRSPLPPQARAHGRRRAQGRSGRARALPALPPCSRQRARGAASAAARTRARARASALLARGGGIQVILRA